MQEKIAGMKESNDELKSEKDGVCRILESMTAKFKSLENEYAIVTKQKHEIEAKLKENESLLNGLNDKFKVKIVMLADQNETICQLKEDKTELKHTIDAYCDKEKELKEKQSDLLSEMDDLKDNYMILQNKMDKYNESDCKQVKNIINYIKKRRRD